MSELLTEAEIINLLRAKHGPPEWLFADHVKDAAGFGSRRAIDGLAFNTFGSRGFAFVGYEIKRTRSDFLRELKDPHKAEAVAKFCNRFSILAADNSVASSDELPLGWGLYVVNSKGTGLLTKKQPAERKHVVEIDRPFLAAIVRRIQKSEREDFDAFAEARSQGFQNGRQSMEESNRRDKEARATLEAEVADFEKRSGIRLRGWQGPEMGDAVRIILGNGRLRQTQAARRFVEGLEKATERARATVVQLEEIEARATEPVDGSET